MCNKINIQSSQCTLCSDLSPCLVPIHVCAFHVCAVELHTSCVKKHMQYLVLECVYNGHCDGVDCRIMFCKGSIEAVKTICI